MTAGKKFHCEDLPPGFSFETESVTFSEKEIVAFARRYDPLPSLKTFQLRELVPALVDMHRAKLGAAVQGRYGLAGV